MSLRAFHLLFIIASITLSLMMAVWGGVTYGTDRGTVWHLVTVIGALLTAPQISVWNFNNGLLTLLSRYCKINKMGYVCPHQPDKHRNTEFFPNEANYICNIS